MEEKKNVDKNKELQKALEYWAHIGRDSSSGINDTALSVGALTHASYLVIRKALDKASEDPEHENDALMLQGLLGLHQLAEFMSTYLKYDGAELSQEIKKSADALCATVDLLPK